MSTPIEGLPRRVIPRWRNLRAAAELGELSSFEEVSNDFAFPSELDALKRLWRLRRNDVIAGELLSAAWLEGNVEQAREAAHFILRRDSDASVLAKDLAEEVLAETESQTKAERDVIDALDAATVRSIRHGLRLYPYDAIGWCELARYYTIIGKRVKARRALMTALQLAPESRYILRSVARGLIH